MIMACADMRLTAGRNKFDKPQLKVTYVGQDGAEIHEVWPLSTKRQKEEFLAKFINPHMVDRHRPFTDTAPSKIVRAEHRLRFPDFVVARKNGRFWAIRDKIFDLNQFASQQEVRTMLTNVA